MTAPRIIVLWAVPRSRSTAFERMMLQRDDLSVVHEPFSYLMITSTFTVGSITAASLPELLDALLLRSVDDRLFIKETTDYAYAPLLADPRLYSEVAHTFLIRDPDAVVASYHAMKPEMALEEIGFERMHTLFDAVRQATGQVPVVIDADDLMREPHAIVREYCRRVDLPYDERSLRWEPSSRPEWETTQAWHRDASVSTGFTDFGRTYQANPSTDPRLAEVAAYHRPFYERMHACRLLAGSGAGST